MATRLCFRSVRIQRHAAENVSVSVNLLVTTIILAQQFIRHSNTAGVTTTGQTRFSHRWYSVILFSRPPPRPISAADY